MERNTWKGECNRERNVLSRSRICRKAVDTGSALMSQIVEVNKNEMTLSSAWKYRVCIRRYMYL